MKPTRTGELASIVQRLSVLLAAGVTPTTAWAYLIDTRPYAVEGEELAAHGRAGGSAHRDPKVDLMVESVSEVALRGGDVPAAIIEASTTLVPEEQNSWRGLAAAWRVATDAGAPMASSLADFATALRSHADADREIEVALAGPVATSRLVMVLPAIGVLFGLVLGFDSVHVLLTTQPGIACLLVGIALMVIARRWSNRLVRTAQQRDATPGLRLELTAIAVAGGGALDQAEASVAAALAECGLDADFERNDVESVLALSRRAGVPAAALLRSEATERRRNSRADANKAAAVLAVRLMLPLGVCVLPAFMALGVAPLLIAIISSTVAAF